MIKATVVNATFEIGHHGCALVCTRLDELSRESGIDVTTWLPLTAGAEQIARTKCDIVIVNGEGTLHHDRPGSKRIGKLGSELRKLGLPAYLINTVYQGNSPSVADGVGAYRKVWVRESLSASEIAKEGISCAIVPDLSLTWWQDPPANGGTSLVVLDAVDDEEVQQLFMLSRRHHAPFYSIMTKPPQIPTFPDHNLRRISKYHWRRFRAYVRSPSSKRSKWLNQFPSFGTFIDRMTTEAGLIVTGRLHAVCLALGLEIPVLAVPSNTHKIEGLLLDAGLEKRAVKNIGEVDLRLLEKPLPSFAYSAEELLRIRAYRNRALTDARRMFREIRDGLPSFVRNHGLAEDVTNPQWPISASKLAPMSNYGAYE